MNREREGRSWRAWSTLGHWVMGAGGGCAAVMKWPELYKWEYLPLCLVIVGYLMVNGPGAKRDEE